MVDRPEIYYLKMLKLGLAMQTSDIVAEMNLMGWKTNKSTISRLCTGSNLNIDVAGLPFFAIRCLFPSAVACDAQAVTWMVRRALSQKLKGDELENVLCHAEGKLAETLDLLGQFKQAADEETEAERALDRASIDEAYGQILATRRDHHGALQRFLAAYTLLLPYARRPGCNIGITICIGRVLGAALSEAYDCDERMGRVVGSGPIGPDWHLSKVLKHYRHPSLFDLLAECVNRTGDDRVAANHSDGFTLAGELRQAARMMQVGLAHAQKGSTIETWQPQGRSSPVVAEPYMQDALAEYRRLGEQAEPKITPEKKARTMKRVMIAIIGIATLITLIAHVDPAAARPERITALQVATNIG